jgi:3',5'-cyclic AMP phosphodiesterase CpdA
MRRIVHLSDLHFGRVDPDTLSPLVKAIHGVQPHLTVISGDLTQDARDSEFRDARRFLESLPEPRLVTPGNHDMPFYNPVARLLVGLDRYRRHITAELTPFWADEEIAVMAVNTARSYSVRHGRIHQRQVEEIERRLGPLSDRTRVLVTHHPFDLPESYHRRELLNRAREGLTRLAGSIDVLLAGHMHISYAGSTAVRHRIERQSAIFVQAGTATSTRNRGEPNAFNVLTAERPMVAVQRFAWDAERALFLSAPAEHFKLWAAGDAPDESHALR